MQSAAELMDAINREAWRTQDAVDCYRCLEGWTDAGERIAIERIASEVKGQPILDLGVGAGRTVPLLCAISQDYTAIDYTPELVRICQNKYPDHRICNGDARDLSLFADESFALVVFSFNGIDAVNPDDRMKVLREAHRVLRPGGFLLFSTHNQQGSGHDEGFKLGVYWTRNPFKLASRMIRALRQIFRTTSNYRRYSGLNQHAEGYSIKNAAVHNHGIVIHYITLAKQFEQLASAGYCPDSEAYGSHDGQQLTPGDDTHRHMWFHFVARKPHADAGTGGS